MNTTPAHDLICVGVVASAHGIQGQLKIKTFTESLSSFESFPQLLDGTASKSYTFTIKGEAKGQLIASIKEVTSRNEAEAMRGTKLYVKREHLPKIEEEECFYYEDLVGAKVSDEDGQPIGTVVQLYNFGAGDLIEVQLSNGEKKDFIFNKTTFPAVDIKNKELTLHLPEEIDATNPQKKSGD